MSQPLPYQLKRYLPLAIILTITGLGILAATLLSLRSQDIRHRAAPGDTPPAQIYLGPLTSSFEPNQSSNISVWLQTSSNNPLTNIDGLQFTVHITGTLLDDIEFIPSTTNPKLETVHNHKSVDGNTVTIHYAAASIDPQDPASVSPVSQLGEFQFTNPATGTVTFTFDSNTAVIQHQTQTNLVAQPSPNTYTLAPLPNPSPISWITPHVTFTASNFYLAINGQIYTPQTATDLDLNSTLHSENSASLEASWTQHDRTMRVLMSFSRFEHPDHANSLYWQLDSVKTLDGTEPGEWLTYQLTEGSTNLAPSHPDGTPMTRPDAPLNLFTTPNQTASGHFHAHSLSLLPNFEATQDPPTQTDFQLSPHPSPGPITLYGPGSYTVGINLYQNNQYVTDQSDFSYSWSIQDESIVTGTPTSGPCPSGLPQSACPNNYLILNPVNHGTTTVTGTATQISTNQEIGTITFTINYVPTSTTDHTLRVKFKGISRNVGPVPAQLTWTPSSSSTAAVINPVTFTHYQNGIYQTTLTLPQNTQQIILAIKGSKHVQKVFRNLTVTSTIDLTASTLEPGDLPPQDNVVNIHDLNKVLEALANPSQTPDQLATADVNFDGIVNAGDMSLILSTLSTKPDETIN